MDSPVRPVAPMTATLMGAAAIVSLVILSLCQKFRMSEYTCSIAIYATKTSPVYFSLLEILHRECRIYIHIHLALAGTIFACGSECNPFPLSFSFPTLYYPYLSSVLSETFVSGVGFLSLYLGSQSATILATLGTYRKEDRALLRKV